MSLRARPYLSYSQLVTVENGAKQYIEKYVYGWEQRVSRAMAYGSKFADSLEKGEDTGDVALDIMTAQLPKFEMADVPFMTEIPGDKKNETVPVLIKMDSWKKDLSAFKEYKTGTTKWTQKKVDDSGQITFYAMGAYLKTGKIPQDIELIHLPTEYDVYGMPHLTGEMHRFPTKRSLVQILRMMVKARKAWNTIGKILEEEVI